MKTIRGVFDFAELEKKQQDLEKQLQDPSVWADQKLASELGQRVREIKETTSLFESWDTIISDAETAIEIADEELIKEAETALTDLEKQLDKYDIQKMLSGEYDDADAFLSINAGAGGTDAQDWANMLLRMYIRWAESRNWKVELIDKSDGEEAGIKSATIKISGKYAYGYAKAEKGVHRLVRISPFNANGKRQTSFASCDISYIFLKGSIAKSYLSAISFIRLAADLTSNFSSSSRPRTMFSAAEKTSTNLKC